MLLGKAETNLETENLQFEGPGIIVESGKAVDRAFVDKAFIERFVNAIAQHPFDERTDLDSVVT